MTDLALRIYHAAPAPVRSLLASLRGYHLNAWRYGPETDELVNEALEREFWSAGQWQQWHENQLSRVLHIAATRVSYYRQQWSERRRKGDRASWEYLENWPILDKENVRANPRAFLADGCDPRRMYHDHTSGTTAKPLDIWMNRRTLRMNYALFEARCRRWHGVSREDRWAIMGGQLVTPVENRQPPFWVWNSGLRQLYLSSYHLAPDLIPYYLDAIRRYDIRYIVGYASSLNALAQEILRSGRIDVRLQYALANAEPVYSHQRDAISRAFQGPVRETYGMAEIVVSATECPGGSMHFWPELGWTEVLDRHRNPVADGFAGDLICTGLLNEDMPFIRYHTGDRGTVLKDGERCSCGRTMPILASVEGRTDDILYTLDGRSVGRLDPAFKSQFPIREAQVIQESIDRLRFRYVPAESFDAETAKCIVSRLQARMGRVHVILEPVEQIPREANGKFRAVVCRLSAEERAGLQ